MKIANNNNKFLKSFNEIKKFLRLYEKLFNKVFHPEDVVIMEFFEFLQIKENVFSYLLLFEI